MPEQPISPAQIQSALIDALRGIPDVEIVDHESGRQVGSPTAYDYESIKILSDEAEDALRASVATGAGVSARQVIHRLLEAVADYLARIKADPRQARFHCLDLERSPLPEVYAPIRYRGYPVVLYSPDQAGRYGLMVAISVPEETLES